jgi:hypothetical protein
MPNSSRTPALVDEIEAARILNLSEKTLRRWRGARLGPSFCKLGGAVRYSLTDLDLFVAAGRRPCTGRAS